MPETKRARRTRVLQLVTVFFLLFLLVFILGTESVRAAAGVGRETVRTETLTRALTGTGTLFFTETTVINNHNNGPVEYAVKNGGTVEPEALLARVYRDDTGTDGRERAAALYEEIELLESALAGTGSDESFELSYLRAYGEYTRAKSAGDAVAAGEAEETLQYLLLCRKAAENAAELEARVAELRAKIAAMLQFAGEPDTVPAAAGGIFYRTTDGYESVLTPDAAIGLTPAGLRELTAAMVELPTGTPKPIGKITATGGFAVAVPASANKALFFKEGNTYPVVFEDGGVQIQMTLTSVRASTDGKEALLVFTADTVPLFGDALRFRRVRVELEEITGLSVPEGAMRTQNNREGVFVLTDGYAAWRPVRILYRADGCCIVAPAEKEPTKQAQPELAAGDTVLVTSRGLYEGKAIP